MPNPNKYQVGDAVRVNGEFRDQNNTLIDPPVLRFKFKKPDGTITTYVYGTDAQVVRVSTGIYFVLVDSNTYGDWKYRWETEGAGGALDSKSAEENYYSVTSFVV